MRKLVWLAVLCGCATVPMARHDLDARAKDSKPFTGAANVFVYRPASVAGTAVKLEVFFDEAWVGDLASGTFAEIAARPGEHKIVVRARGRAEKTIVVEAGRSYFLKATPTWGFRGPNASIELATDENAAREDVRRCELIAGVAPQIIRDVAARVGEVSVRPVQPDALVAVAARAIEGMGGEAMARDGEAPRDLETTIARLHATSPAIDDRQILLAAARAMAAALRREPPEDPTASQTALDRSCGLVVARRGDRVVVAGAIPDSPAAWAGVEGGPELRDVNGHSTRDRTPSEVVQLLAGIAGSEAVLTLANADGAGRTLVLRRAAAVETDAVDCRVVDGRVLYLRPWRLEAATARRVRDDARSAGIPARLVILDLRDTLGGSVQGARDLADSFLSGGPIVSIAGTRRAGLDETYSATPGTSVLEQARVVVLVNEKTRGTAEAVAAAVQDHRRGTVLGARTAGDATVEVAQTFRTVTLPVPVGYLLRASGQRLDGGGVVPDVLEGVSDAARSAIARDEACPNVASTHAVADDPLVRRAASLLLTLSPTAAGEPP